jgi:hypothetical protein
VPDAKRLKELETENARLQNLLAEQVLENGVIMNALRKSGDRTGQAEPERQHRIGQRPLGNECLSEH